MKSKYTLSFLLFCGLFFLGSAQKYKTKTGTVKFEASVPSFEEVAGESKSVSAVLDTDKGNIAVLALVKGFRFEIALMEEHFNENYAESGQFPKATFSGVINDFKLSALNASPKSYTVSGDFTFHGKTKKITSAAKISKTGDKILIAGDFKVKPEDFGIEIPGIVREKVAKTVTVSYNFLLTE